MFNHSVYIMKIGVYKKPPAFTGVDARCYFKYNVIKMIIQFLLCYRIVKMVVVNEGGEY